MQTALLFLARGGRRKVEVFERGPYRAPEVSMSRMDVAVALALEVWRASGERTAERLERLFNHYADQYGLTDEFRAGAWSVTLRKAGL